MRLRRQPNAERRGAAVVELAAIVPVLAVLSIGMIEMTRLVQVKHALTGCAREACRRAILPRATTTGVKANLNAMLAANNIPTANVTTTIMINGVAGDISTAQQNDTIAVQLSVPSNSVKWVSTPLFSGGTITTESLTMMKQY